VVPAEGDVRRDAPGPGGRPPRVVTVSGVRTGVVVTLFAVATVIVGGSSALATATGDGDTAPCPVTTPNGHVPTIYGFPARDAGVNHGNGRLYVGLWTNGVVSVPASEFASKGEVDAKFGWWRAIRGTLRITATRIDAAAGPGRPHVPLGYGNKYFQSSAIAFPTTGCWRVTGVVGRKARLSFVTRVVAKP